MHTNTSKAASEECPENDLPFEPETHDENTEESDFYKNAQKYWSKVPPTVNGMLGGLGFISNLDLQCSNSYLKNLKGLGNNLALDCGAGIGRVTKNLLMPLFSQVDIVEQNKEFTEKAEVLCSTQNDSKTCYSRLGNVYNVGLQDFTPDAGKYDLVWSQWVLGHLTDEDLLQFFIRIRKGLAKGGYLVLKENASKRVEADVEDSSVTRPLKQYEKILSQAEFKVLNVTLQKAFPKGLYPVYMIACRPKKN